MSVLMLWTTVVHTTAQNSSDKIPFYLPVNHDSSDIVYHNNHKYSACEGDVIHSSLIYHNFCEKVMHT